MYFRVARFSVILAALVLASCTSAINAAGEEAQGQPIQVQQTKDAVRINLSNGTMLEFALAGDYLLGLQQASVEKHTLTSNQTVQRPLVAQEFGNKGVWPFMKLLEVKEHGGEVHIKTQLMGGDIEAIWREEFVYTGDRQAALRQGMTPELKAWKAKADAALKLMNQAVATDKQVAQALQILAEAQDELAKEQEAKGNNVPRLLQQVRRWEDRLENRQKAAYPTLADRDDEAGQAYATFQKYQQMLNEVALEIGKIHRDYYAFAILQLPSETCRIDALKQRLQKHQDALTEGGTLTWIIKPVDRTIAGWPWQGWSVAYKVELNKGHEVNNIRQLGTWEIDGSLNDLTVVNLRYRGLGEIEQEVETNEQGAVTSAWTTTEIMPGAVGGGPVVSPAIPASAEKKMTDRGYALQHRVGAWISKMGRGSGVGFVDFQHKGEATLISYMEKQGSYRAVSEMFPGDKQLSQTDEQWFANTRQFTSEPQLYLALVSDKSQARNEMQTRWQEVDQYVRDLVSRELGFKQVPPLPGVGWLVEAGRPGYIGGLANGGVKRWYDQGVRMIVTHTPGWHTEQHRDGWDKPRTPGGNSNKIYDWVPTADVREQWKGLQQACADLGIPYYIYMTGMSENSGPFAKEVGPEIENWGTNLPGSTFSHGYPPQLQSHNLHREHVRKLLMKKLEDVRTQFGMQGIWADSFQNMYMSQLDWANGSGAPMQRIWWETIAELSRNGVNWMAESHAFPGLSCSLEVPGWEEDYHYFQYVWKWHRGTSQRNYSPQQHDEMEFKFMANKSWLAPDGNPEVVPSFKRYSAEYMAALPMMRRSSVLPDGMGVLWRPFDSDTRGVWFAYKDAKVPAGVTAVPILEKKSMALSEVKARHTYTVTGMNLTEQFGMATPPEKDERKELKYEPVEFVFPKWTQKDE